MRIALISPIAWRTPPKKYGPWEQVVVLLADGLAARGHDVTLFATGDSRTAVRLRAVCPRPYEEDKSLDSKVWECMHIAEVFEHADDFDIIHNHFDFLPLSYAGLAAGDSVDIPRNTFHRIANAGKEDMVFIEVQQGAYFGEDDIERLEDDYGRV
ncbi:MAG: glycosyltransferase [Deltaproteobacteria bacterium]|nr:glycosyltransferase [Deltaproteobacteria bacterium]